MKKINAQKNKNNKPVSEIELNHVELLKLSKEKLYILNTANTLIPYTFIAYYKYVESHRSKKVLDNISMSKTSQLALIKFINRSTYNTETDVLNEYDIFILLRLIDPNNILLLDKSVLEKLFRNKEEVFYGRELLWKLKYILDYKYGDIAKRILSLTTIDIFKNNN